MSDSTPPKLIRLYQSMADLTLPECRSCRAPYACCSPEHCEMAEQIALERGVKLKRTLHPRLPFMGLTGCVVPPHLRPHCTVHTCDIGAMGFKKDGDPTGAWTRRYFDLRAEIEVEELRLRGINVDP